MATWPRLSSGAAAASAVDSLFPLHERGTSTLREVRGGVATFFAPAYIVVLNPLVLGSGKDVYGHALDTAQLTVATAVVAGVMTILMGLGGNLPLAIAAAPALLFVAYFALSPIEQGFGVR